MLNYRIQEDGIHYHDGKQTIAIGYYEHKKGTWGLKIDPNILAIKNLELFTRMEEASYPSTKALEWAALLINEFWKSWQ